MKTVWLASYPKSGNTWFRLLLANLAARDTPVDINAISLTSRMASEREPFDDYLMFDSDLLTHDEIDELRPGIYAAIAAERAKESGAATGPPVCFVKAHEAYTLTAAGEPLMGGARGADRAIVLVRDPRDLASSLANHNRSTVDIAIDVMNNAEAAHCAGPHRRYNQLRQRLTTWSQHIASWLDQRDIPVHLVRYEDMLAAPADVFAHALRFAGCDCDGAAIERAVRFSEFTLLQGQERERGFGEWRDDSGGRHFFRQGKAGMWRQELSEAQVARIEAAHHTMMRRLGYAPVTIGAAARAG